MILWLSLYICIYMLEWRSVRRAQAWKEMSIKMQFNIKHVPFHDYSSGHITLWQEFCSILLEFILQSVRAHTHTREKEREIPEQQFKIKSNPNLIAYVNRILWSVFYFIFYVLLPIRTVTYRKFVLCMNHIRM